MELTGVSSSRRVERKPAGAEMRLLRSAGDDEMTANLLDLV